MKATLQCYWVGCAHPQAAQKVGLVAQTGLAQSVAGLGAGTVNATQFSADTSPDNLNVRLHGHLPCRLLSTSTAQLRSMIGLMLTSYAHLHQGKGNPAPAQQTAVCNGHTTLQLHG